MSACIAATLASAVSIISDRLSSASVASLSDAWAVASSSNDRANLGLAGLELLEPGARLGFGGLGGGRARVDSRCALGEGPLVLGHLGGALLEVGAGAVDVQLLLRDDLLDLLGAVLAVGELLLERREARLTLGQLDRTEGAAVAQLLDERVALALDLLALALHVLDLALERRHGLFELLRASAVNRRRSVGGRSGGGCGGGARSRSRSTSSCSRRSSSAWRSPRRAFALFEPGALGGVDVATGVRRRDAFADGQGGLALGELALAPGEPCLALGEHDLGLLLERRLLALEALLGFLERGHPVFHRASEPACGLVACGLFRLCLGVAHVSDLLG